MMNSGDKELKKYRYPPGDRHGQRWQHRHLIELTLKYQLTALALKSLCSCDPTRRLYRKLGNWAGTWGRCSRQMPYCYYERAERNLAWYTKNVPIGPDDRTIEIGTGWVHWDAVPLLVLCDVRATLYDMWRTPFGCVIGSS